MKNTKMLFLSILVIGSSACAMNLEQSATTEKLFTEKMQKAAISLSAVINNCDKADGNHELRMNELKDSSLNLSISQFNDVMQGQSEFAKNKYKQYRCQNCYEIALFVAANNFVYLEADKQEKGNMLVADLVKELRK